MPLLKLRQADNPMNTVHESDTTRSIERRIERVYQLPPMPDLGQRILALQADPGAGVRELARIVQLDPSLAAQVIRYAGSSYYGYSGRVTNVQEAIARVLGYDMVLNLALGLAAGRSFRIPEAGPLGLPRFWEHAVCSAVLAEKLAALVPKPLRPPTGCSYLCGLLQDFGILLLGHLFPPEFQLLNKLAAAHPQASIPELEQRLLGMGCAGDVLAMGHARIGAWLMNAWKMPEPVCITLLEHHNPDYRGDHEVLVHLVQLVDLLLQQGPESDPLERIPARSVAILEVSEARVAEALAQLDDARDDLHSLALSLAKAS
jgi:HD-like signal output (HDOD) protein